MTAYLYGEFVVEDAALYARYRERVAEVVAAFGGRYLVRGGQVEALEGELIGRRVVVIAFPDRKRALAFYRSPAYQAILPLRLRAARGRLLLLEGVEGEAPA